MRRGSHVSAVLVVATLLAIAGLASTPRPVAASWERTLTVDFAFGLDYGDGSGTVTSDDGAISCSYSGYGTSGDCSEHYIFPNFSTSYDVTLTFNPSAHSIACTNISSGCAFPGQNAALPIHFDLGSGGDVNVRGSFSLEFVEVGVSLKGPGTVTSNSEVTCSMPGSDLCWTYKYGYPVTLTASPNSGYPFTWWLGSPCEATATYKNPTCSFTARGTSLTAVFGYVPLTIHSSTGGSICEYGGALCLQGQTALREYRLIGTSQTFTAIEEDGYAFDHWNAGPCAGKTIRCTFTLSGATDLTATFRKLATPAPTPKPTPKPSAKPTPTPRPGASSTPGSTAPPSEPGPTPPPATAGDPATTVDPGATAPGPGATTASETLTAAIETPAGGATDGNPAPQTADAHPVDVTAPTGGADIALLVALGGAGILVLLVAAYLLGRRAARRPASQR